MIFRAIVIFTAKNGSSKVGNTGGKASGGSCGKATRNVTLEKQ